MFDVFKQVALSRKELHSLVWSKPMTKAAAEIGISDVALAKCCRRNGIPLPPQGFWARSEPRPKPVPLPPPRPGLFEHIHFQIVAKAESVASLKLAEVASEIAQVRLDLKRACSIVKEANRLYRSAREEKGLLVAPRNAEVAHLNVSRDQLDRALRIFDAVVCTANAMGGAWGADKEGAWLDAMGGRIHVDILENRKQSQVADRYWPGHMATELIPTGKLRFRLGTYGPNPSDLRDADGAPLESKIVKVATYLIQQCHLAKVESDKRAEGLRIRQENDAKRLHTLRALEAERIVRERLIAAADLHQASEAIRKLCSALLSKESSDDAAARALREWVGWALSEADRMDPVGKDSLPIDMEVDPSLLRNVKLQNWPI